MRSLPEAAASKLIFFGLAMLLNEAYSRRTREESSETAGVEQMVLLTLMVAR